MGDVDNCTSKALPSYSFSVPRDCDADRTPPARSDSHGGKALARNRASDYVVYGFTWTPDYLSWTVEGKTVRTLQRDDTLDKTSGLYKFPQTPSRVQFS